MRGRARQGFTREEYGKWFPRSVAAAAILAASSFVVAPASADPIRNVTSGIIYMLAQDNETGFVFRGASFDIEGGGIIRNPLSPCGPCAAGSSVNLSATFTPDSSAGSATINGHTYDTVYFSGDLNATAGSITVPEVAPYGHYVYPSTWFRFSGSIAGYGDPSLGGTPLFSTRLAGRGTANQGFFNDGTGTFTDAFNYEFADAAPTPEPASLLLFAPGATWVLMRFRARRRNTPEG